MAQNFEPFSAHVKDQIRRVSSNLKMRAVSQLHTPSHVRPDALAAGSLCTISWPMQYLNNILANTLVVQYPAQYFIVQFTICCLIPNMLPNITQPLRPQNQRDPTHLLSKAQQGHPYKKKNILSLIWVLLDEL